METKDKNPSAGFSDVQASEPVVTSVDNGQVVVEETEQIIEKKPRQPSQSPFKESIRRLRRDKRAMISVIVIALIIIIPLVLPPIYQRVGGVYESPTVGKITPDVYHSFYHTELTRQDETPSAQYWLGTDAIGRDILARLMQGLLISMVVALVVEVIAVTLGISIGVLAGYYGGWIDQFLARFTDIIFAFPGLLFLIMITGIFGSEADTYFAKVPIVGANGQARLILVSMILALISWPLMARLVRGQTLQLKQQQFVEAAKTSGTSDILIILRHIIPNLTSIVIVTSTLNISGTIIGEAGLSFLGLGVKTPGSSLGLMISDSIVLIESHPWEILLPASVLTIIVLAFTFLGDGLRDAFDPRSKD